MKHGFKAIKPNRGFSPSPTVLAALAVVAVALVTAGCAAESTSPAPKSSAHAPNVRRVEPPSWWANHTVNPVRLLITGEQLTGATLAAPAGFKIGPAKVSADGRYAFADLTIPAAARPGRYDITLSTPGGRTAVPFTIAPPLPATGKVQGFTTNDVIYLIMTDRFANGDAANDHPPGSPNLFDRRKGRHYHGGDLQGVIDRLDYLEDLGVTAIWLTPWYDNADALNHFEKYTHDNQLSKQGEPTTDYHGYGAVNFYATEERFGSLEKLRELVDAAHRRGIKVIQDQVANHTGPQHPWAHRPPTPTWFNGCPTNHLANTWQIWTTTKPNPPADQLKSTLEGWFIDILPDLNQNDPEVATYLIQNSLWWVGMTGLDAVRQDTLPYVPRSYWAQWTAALKRQHPNLTILGELWDADPKIVSFFQGGQKQFDGVDTGVETLFDFPMYYAIRDVFINGAPMDKLTTTLAADTNYVDASGLVPFLGLHDTARFLHEPGATENSLRMAFSYLLTARGTPLIYYGDEIGMTGGRDPDNRRDFPGGWSEDPQNAFTKDGRTAAQEAMHAHVKKLLTLRRELAPLREGAQRSLMSTRDTHAFARIAGHSLALVALNNSAAPQQLDIPLEGLPLAGVRQWQDHFGTAGVVAVPGNRLSLQLPARSVAILTPHPTDLAQVPTHETQE